jgi:hypothetical protein
MSDLVEVWVRTRHPEHYRLVNKADGTEWVIRDGAWVAAHEDGASGGITRERDRRTVTKVVTAWVAACVEVTGDSGAEGEVRAADLAVSLNTWLAFEGRPALPGSKALTREVLEEQVRAAGGRFDKKAKVWRRVRLV